MLADYCTADVITHWSWFYSTKEIDSPPFLWLMQPTWRKVKKAWSFCWESLSMTNTAPLTSKRCILYIYLYSINIGTEYFKHALYSPFFLSSKCSLFHNANLFGSCIILTTSVSPVRNIPPLLHTNPSIYHTSCIIFSPTTSVSPVCIIPQMLHSFLHLQFLQCKGRHVWRIPQEWITRFVGRHSVNGKEPIIMYCIVIYLGHSRPVTGLL